jgi:hypothetical protein
VSITRINADFQNVSSYILADSFDILSPRIAHLPLLWERFAQADLSPEKKGTGRDATEDIGVPLLLPLTMGLELEQTSCPQFPTKRSVCINVDPLSIMLGSEDLQLVDSVVRHWSSKSKKSDGMHEYDVIFRSERLGLGLRKDDIRIVVDYVKDPALSKGVLYGDAIHSINGIRVCTDTTLLSIVDQLAQSHRPLRVTFRRPLEAKVSEEDTTSSEHRKDSYVSMDVLFSSAILTFVERDAPLLRGQVHEAKLSYGLTQGAGTNQRLAISSSLAIYCYNLSIWGWEPLMEEGTIALAAELQEPEEGARQLTFEVGDGQEGLAMNFTDAAAETISKVIEWSRHSERNLDGDNHLNDLVDGYNAAQEVRNSSVSRNAANAALQYARRQSHGSAKSFVFRNRTGLSVAVVQQQPKGFEVQRSVSTPFLAVGDYCGIELFDPSQITLVGSGEEFAFRVDVIDDVYGENMSCAKFPSLVVSLQTIGRIAFDPLLDLQIHRAGETIVPLRYCKVEEKQDAKVRPRSGQLLAVWRIEHVDEKTMMTLGGATQILSLLPYPIEVLVRIGLAETAVAKNEETKLKSIGSAYPGYPFFLPLWLEMQEEIWSCSVKIDNEHRAARLFSRSADGFYDFSPLSETTVGFAHRRGNDPSIWLAGLATEDGGVFTVTLDSLFSLRNLLPTEVEWEVANSDLTTIDGSGPRNSTIYGGICFLESGEKTEVLAKTIKGVAGRFRPKGMAIWSQWVLLSLDPRVSTMEATLDGDTESRQEVVISRYAQSCDAFGVPHTIGVRVSPKECGFDVILFAELWCINCTALDLTFGAPRDKGQIKTETDPTTMLPADLSAAEAALKEISSLFESGQDGKGLRLDANAGRSFVDTVRLAGQGTPHVVEECFEYIDTVSTQRWWASENPACKFPDPTGVIDGGSAGWFWIDPDWVSASSEY